MNLAAREALPSLLGLFLLVLAACGGTGPQVSGPKVRESPGVDWTHSTTVYTVQVSSFEEAEAVVGFSLLVPRVGSPDGIYVSDLAKIPPDEAFVELVYLRHPAGPFWILEAAAGPDWRDNFDALVAQCDANPACRGQQSVVHIRGGLWAWLSVDADSTLLLWREGDLEVRLMGPRSSFSPDVALRIAEEL
jgi:hypothetical protein